MQQKLSNDFIQYKKPMHGLVLYENETIAD